MDKMQRIVRRIINILTIAGMASLLIMMILTVVNIVFRPIGHSIMGIIEISQLLIVITVAFAIGYTALKDGHVAMASFTGKMSNSVKKYLKIFSNILTISIWGMIAWYNFKFAWEKTLLGESSIIANYPIYPFRYIWGFGCIILCLIVIPDNFDPKEYRGKNLIHLDVVTRSH
jgi:TRAP-type C4-dicarboxylate transport system permease small subunit